MPYPHRIRLRGPWECEPLASFGSPETPLPPPQRMILPCRWGEGGLGNFAGRVRFRRRFGYPGRIDSYERVWLTFAGADAVAEVWLNGRRLGRHEGAQEPFEFEVTDLLADRNELVVEVEAPQSNGGLWGEVAMEVRCSAYLRAVHWWATSTGDRVELHAAGDVVGTCERPLELYLLLDNRTVAYATTEAAPEGRAFHLVSEALNAEQWPSDGERQGHIVRVDLVNGARIWFTAVEALRAPPAPSPGHG